MSYTTVGELLKYIKDNNISIDAEIYIQRVSDVYFEQGGWNKQIIKKPSDMTHTCLKWNDDIDNGKYLDKEQFPLIKKDDLIKFDEEYIKQTYDQYYGASQPVKYSDDGKLYLMAHY